MTVELNDIRKVAVIGWDTSIVLGEEATLKGGEGADAGTRTVKNDGESNLFFPLDFEGDVAVTVTGSDGGEDTGTISVT